MPNRIDRRRWINHVNAIALTGLAGSQLRCGRALANEPAIEILASDVISNYSDLYHGWPTLTRTGEGELWVVYSGGRQGHVCPFGRVECIRSKDQGRTWTFPRVLLDGALDDRDAGICATAKGSLLVTTFTSNAYESPMSKLTGKDLERWQAVHQRLSEAQRADELGVWMIRSTDGGISWSQRYPSVVNSPHGPVQLSDGRILYAGVQLWKEPRRVGVAVSDDDGQSWDWLAQIPTRAGDDGTQYHELHMVECRSGKLVVHIRNHNSANARETLQSESSDGGASWSEPHAIGVWGLPSYLQRLSDGRLMMTYGYRRPPYGNQVRFSDDQASEWGPPLTLSEDGVGGDLGYPSSVELDNGDFYSVWYEKLQGRPAAVLRGRAGEWYRTSETGPGVLQPWLGR